MQDFYQRFYAAAETSQAHHTFCERVFGQDLCQHGFVDQAQLELLLAVIQVGPAHRVLDLGCGNGRIAEYLSDRTGAHVTGLDSIDLAIRQAQSRTQAKAPRLSFMVGDINHLALPDQAYDVILALDSIYFSDDCSATIRQLKQALRSSGQLALFYSYGREPWVPRDAFPPEKLLPEKTPLAEALIANGLTFRTWDLTRPDYELAQRRKTVLAELEPEFAAEGNLFIYENRLGDAQGISQAIEEGLHARYLYHAALPDG